MIQSAALLMYDGIIIVGRRHNNCIKKAYEIRYTEQEVKAAIQGFVEEDFVFLDRREAAKHALECGQIKKLQYSDTELYSEDIY